MTEQCETDFLIESLHVLESLYETLHAALEEYDDKKNSMTEYDAEYAHSRIEQIKNDIDSFELMHPDAASKIIHE